MSLTVMNNQSIDQAIEELHIGEELTGEELTRLALQQEQQDRLNMALAVTKQIFKVQIRTNSQNYYQELARQLKDWTEKVLNVYGTGKYKLRIEGLIDSKDDFIKHMLGIPGKTYRNWYNGTKQAPGISKIGIVAWAEYKAGIDTQGKEKKETAGKIPISEMQYDEVLEKLTKAQVKLTDIQKVIGDCQARIEELTELGLVKPEMQEPAAQEPAAQEPAAQEPAAQEPAAQVTPIQPGKNSNKPGKNSKSKKR